MLAMGLPLSATTVWLKVLATSAALVGGIIPDRVNQVVIEGDFSDTTPTFLLVFTAQPLHDGRSRLLTEASPEQFESSTEQVAIKVYGKRAVKPGRFEYSFGTAADADQPWNDGRDFDWRSWDKVSPDIWDHLCILALPFSSGRAANRTASVTGVTIRKGGQLLYDSRAAKSYPNKKPVNAGFPRTNLVGRGDKLPVLNLAVKMDQFRTDYFELGSNKILQLAYSDLGQTDKRKYARRGTNWCTEFASFVYRENGFLTPDPNKSDVHWKNMRLFFESHGKVYSAREVAGWSNARKRSTIKAGTFVSIPIGETTHSIIFTTWVSDGDKPITQYVGVSGNNKGMVWSHAPLKLPTPDQWTSMPAEKLEEYDQKVFFGVLDEAR